MPHQPKHLKLTGDTHPPDVGDDFGAEEETPVMAAAAPAGEEGAAAPLAQQGASAPDAAAPATRTLVVAMPARQYVDEARAQVRARPLATTAAAFFAGFAIAVLTRSR